MERLVDQVKSCVFNYKLDSCCYLASVRIGVLVIGYYNLCASMLSVIATANESFPPLFMKILEAISEDDPSKSLCVLAYATELGFSVLLLSAMHRNDIMLLQVFVYYAIATTIIALLIYSMVIANIDVLIKITMVINIVYQCYIILLVRSAIVEIKDEAKHNGDLSKDPTAISMKPVPDVEAPPERKIEIFAKVGQKEDETKKDGQIKITEKVQDEDKDKIEASTTYKEPVEVVKRKGKETKKKEDNLETKEEKKEEEADKLRETTKKEEVKKSFFFSRKESGKKKDMKKEPDVKLESVDEVSKQ